jgi:cell division septation protein DedD
LTNKKKANNSKSFIIIALLIILSGVALFYFLSEGGQDAAQDDTVVRKSIRVTDPRKPTATAKAKTQVAATKTRTSVKVVAPKKTTARAMVTAPKKTLKKSAKSSTRRMYAIHLASFNAEKYARRLEKAIDRAGYNAYVTNFIKDNTNWYRVRVGFFKSKEDASKTSAIISKRFKQPGAWLVRPPKKEIEENKI